MSLKPLKTFKNYQIDLITELEPRPPLKKSGFPGQILIKLKL